jgi:ketosteroid isomerase-like protein
MDNVEFVKSMYAAFMNGDIDMILAGTDPNIDWKSNADPALLPWGGERKSLGEIRAFFSEIANNVDFESFTPTEFHAGSDFVLVLGRSSGRMKQSGAHFDDEWAHFFRIANGKVIVYRQYLDTHGAVQAFIGGDVHAIGLPSSPQAAAPRHH